jgi:hypothetical protein
VPNGGDAALLEPAGPGPFFGSGRKIEPLF